MPTLATNPANWSGLLAVDKLTTRANWEEIAGEQEISQPHQRFNLVELAADFD